LLLISLSWDFEENKNSVDTWNARAAYYEERDEKTCVLIFAEYNARGFQKSYSLYLKDKIEYQ